MSYGSRMVHPQHSEQMHQILSRFALAVRFRGSLSRFAFAVRFRGSLSWFRHNVSHKCIRKHLLSYSLIYILSRNQKLYAMSPTMDTHALHTAQRDDFSQLGNAMSLKGPSLAPEPLTQ